MGVPDVGAERWLAVGPGRDPPGHDPAVPARLARQCRRRTAGLRPCHGAPLDPPHNTHGVAALADRPRPGRPRLGSPKLTTRIRQLLTEPKACVRFWSEAGVLVPVVFLMLPVVVLFALYPGLFTLSQLAR
jgi:hypothetical protein